MDFLGAMIADCALLEQSRHRLQETDVAWQPAYQARR